MLEDIHIKPQDWLAHMEKKKNELANAGHIMDDETFLTYVLMSLPQEEYQIIVLVLKDILRKEILEETENLLDDNLKP